MSQGIINALQNVINRIQNEVIARKDIVVGVFFTMIFVTTCGFAFALYRESKLLFRFLIFLSWLICLTLFIVSSLETIIIMFMGDFCMNPTQNILDVISSQAFSYYLTCTGDNPFANSFQSINASTVALTQSINALTVVSPSCSALQAPYTSDMNAQVANMFEPINDCTYINNIYNSFVLQSFCNAGYAGLFNLWILQFCIAILLYFLMSFANAVYQSYVYVDDNADEPLTLKSFEELENVHNVTLNSLQLTDVKWTDNQIKQWNDV
jgi:hypothetical protein